MTHSDETGPVESATKSIQLYIVASSYPGTGQRKGFSGINDIQSTRTRFRRMLLQCEATTLPICSALQPLTSAVNKQQMNVDIP